MATTRKGVKKLTQQIEKTQKEISKPRPKIITTSTPKGQVETPNKLKEIFEVQKKVHENGPPRQPQPCEPGFSSFGMKPRKKLHLQFK